MAHSRAQIAPGLVTEAFLQGDAAGPPRAGPNRPRDGRQGPLRGVLRLPHHRLGHREKGRALLEELLEWATRPQFVYRHRWKANDLVMWDNRTCLHRGRPWDNGVYKRIMHRTTLAGDGPTV